METIPREAALRIALATRVIPGVKVAQLLQVLHDRLSPPLTLEKLTRITVTDIKTGFASADGEEDGEDVRDGVEPYKLAVRILWGESAGDEDLPQPEPYADGDLPGSIRVAVASNTAEELDGHFGSCLRFLVYQVSSSELRLIDVRSTVETELSPDKNLARAQLVEDCAILFVVSIGGPAAAKVVKLGIYPMKKLQGGLARDVVAELQPIIDSPPPWLAKALGVEPSRLRERFAATDGD